MKKKMFVADGRQRVTLERRHGGADVKRKSK